MTVESPDTTSDLPHSKKRPPCRSTVSRRKMGAVDELGRGAASVLIIQRKLRCTPGVVSAGSMSLAFQYKQFYRSVAERNMHSKNVRETVNSGSTTQAHSTHGCRGTYSGLTTGGIQQAREARFPSRTTAGRNAPGWASMPVQPRSDLPSKCVFTQVPSRAFA